MIDALSSPFINHEYPALANPLANQFSRLVYKVAIFVTAVFVGAFLGGWIGGNLLSLSEKISVLVGMSLGAALTPFLFRKLYLPSRYPQYFRDCLKEFSRLYKNYSQFIQYLESKLVCETISFSNLEEMQQFYQNLEEFNDIVNSSSLYESTLWKDFLYYLGRGTASIKNSQIPIETGMIYEHFSKLKERFFDSRRPEFIASREKKILDLATINRMPEEKIAFLKNGIDSLSSSPSFNSVEGMWCLAKEETVVAFARVSKKQILIGNQSQNVLFLEDLLLHPSAIIMRNFKTVYERLLGAYLKAEALIKIVDASNQNELNKYERIGFKKLNQNLSNNPNQVSLIYRN